MVSSLSRRQWIATKAARRRRRPKHAGAQAHFDGLQPLEQRTLLSAYQIFDLGSRPALLTR